MNEDNISTVLINPSAIPQILQDRFNKVYLLSITTERVEQILRIKKPDSILLGFDNETALNWAVKLHESSILQKHSCNVLG